VLICSITGFHSACSPRRRRPLRLRRNRCRRLWTATSVWPWRRSEPVRN